MSDPTLKTYRDDDSSEDEMNDSGYREFEVSSTMHPLEDAPYTKDEEELEELNVPRRGQGNVMMSDGFSDPSSDYYSGQNYCPESSEATGAQLLGANAPRRSYEKKDIQCPFFKRGEKNYCFKGPICQYMHLPHNSKELSKWGTRVRKDYVATASNFKLKVPMHVKSEQQVKIAFVHSPDEFYITKEKANDWLCDCNMVNHENCKDVTVTAEKTINTLTQFMKELSLISYDHRAANFSANEVVSVKIKVGNELKFYRGLMLEGVETRPTESIEYKEVLIKLIDTGETVLMPLPRVSKYVVQYRDIEPPLAYRCQLAGVLPVFDRWTPEACQYFKETITAKNISVRVEIVNTVLYGKGAHLEEKPYSVKLYTGFKDVEPTVYEDVVEKMVRMGYGVALTSTPQFPEECKNHFSMKMRSDLYEQNKLALATKNLHL